MVAGLATLLLYLAPGFSPAQAEVILTFRAYWVSVAVTIAAFAMLLGVFNFWAVHAKRLQQRGGFFSLITFLAFFGVMVASGIDLVKGLPNYAQAASGTWMSWTYRWVLYPLQASFTALLAFLLAFAAYRTLRLRRGLGALIFLGAVLVVLLTQILPGIAGLRDWLVNVWATAGMRGVLLGIALGTLVTMVRVLLGFERPASE